MQASQKGGYIFSPVHIHLSSHVHAITIIQIIIEGLVLIKHNMELMSGHVTNIKIYTELNNISCAESNSKLTDSSLHNHYI